MDDFEKIIPIDSLMGLESKAPKGEIGRAHV
jgi:hypothetical protein